MRVSNLVIAVLISSSIYAQSNDDCFMCHTDNEATMFRGESEISIFVDENNYTNSIHGSMDCIDCHLDFDAEELPHREGEGIYKVDCSNCHDVENFQLSIHNRKNVECFECHSKHEIQPTDLVKADLVNFCMQCHKSETTDKYLNSNHYKKFTENASGPSCIDCHEKDSHSIMEADFNKSEIDEICSKCHNQPHNEYAQSIHALAKEEGTPSCIDCHGSHLINHNKFSISSKACLECHLDKDRFEKIGKENLVEFVNNYKSSTHSHLLDEGIEAATCVDCHDNHIIKGVEETSSLVTHKNQPNTCSKCHSDITSNFKYSSHGITLENGDRFAPSCTDCHGEHDIQSVDRSSTGKVLIKQKCFDCHVNNRELVDKLGEEKFEIEKYEQSAHYIALMGGNENAATCSDCHGAHSMHRATEKEAWISRELEHKTCGQAGCHPDISKEYINTVHGQSLIQGIEDSPTCTDCHGKHQILVTENPDSKVSRGMNVVKLCKNCHADVQLAEKYDFPVDKAASYEENYHGLAVRGGSKFAADCASCHGIHNIRSSNDPLSSIHPDNIAETCGSCHEGANFENGFPDIHLTITEEEYPILYYLKYFYIILIIVVIGGMLIHNILDVIRKTIDRIQNQEHYTHVKTTGKIYLRMNKKERIQHFIMLTSFILLVLTGFALKYPDFILFKWSRELFGAGAFELRSISHRIFGFAMIAVSLYHLYYLEFTKRGRQMLVDFLPKFSDLKEIITNIKWITFISKEKPRFDRFSYMEKAEYWALIWGVIVMGFTGLMLTFNDFMLSIAPAVWLDVATIIHLYEAWLATLAIIVWHFYYVIFNPDVYPLNTAFIKGTITEEQMEHEHPRELKRIKEKK
jgi:predicted CXXCH cytochrome family protein